MARKIEQTETYEDNYYKLDIISDTDEMSSYIDTIRLLREDQEPTEFSENFPIFHITHTGSMSAAPTSTFSI